MITNPLAGQLAPIRMQVANAASKATPAEVTQDFGSFLQDAIDGIAAQEHKVHETTDKFIIGQADVSELMIISEQAKLSLQLTTQIRNKVIEAYHEVMRMQV